MSDAQPNSSANFYPDFVPLADDWNRLFMAKVDADSGFLTNPTVIGNMTLGQQPSLDLHAASKAYVDAVVGGGGGDTGGGIPEAPADGTPYCRLNHDWTPAPTTLGGSVTGDLHVSGGVYSATVSATGDITGLNLHLTGGTIDQGQGGVGTVTVSCQFLVAGPTWLTGAVNAPGGIQGSPIGAVNPSTGGFTSLTTSGTATVGTTLTVNGTGHFNSDLLVGSTVAITAATGAVVTSGQVLAPIGGFSGPIGATGGTNSGAFTSLAVSLAATFAASVAVAGVLTAPTAAQTVNNTQVATTAYVKSAIAAGAGYTLPTATTTVLGGVKIDGTTVTINGTGVISAAVGFSGGTVINPTAFTAAGTALTVTNNARFGPLTTFMNPATSGSARLVLNWASFTDPGDAAGVSFWNTASGAGMFGTSTGNQISFYPSDVNGAPIGNANAYWTRISAAGVSINGTLTTTGNASIGGSLAITGAISGPALTNLFAAPPPIGVTTANTGAFTTLTGTGSTTITANGSSSAAPLTINSDLDPNIYVNSTGTGWPGIKWNAGIANSACGFFQANRMGLPRWTMEMGSAAAELGANAGTTWNLRPFADDGTALPIALSVNRLGVVTVGQAGINNVLAITPGATPTAAVVVATGPGGPLTLSTSDSTTSSAGNITIRGGSSTFATGVGSQVFITTGSSAFLTGGINLTSGNNTGTAPGGQISLTAGNTTGTGTVGGGIILTTGNASAANAHGGNLIVRLGSGGVGGVVGNFQVNGPGAQNYLSVTLGETMSNPIVFAQAGTGGVQFPNVQIGTPGTGSSLTITPGAGATDPVTLVTSGVAPFQIGGGTQNAMMFIPGFSAPNPSSLITTGNGPFQISGPTNVTLGGGGNNRLLLTPGATMTTPAGLSSSNGVGIRFDSIVGFNSTPPVAKPTVTGSRGGNAAVLSILAALSSYGLVTDSTTA